MTSYLNNGFDVMNYFAKFEKFLSHSTIMPSFMTVGGQIPVKSPSSPQYNLGIQNTPYILGLSCKCMFCRIIQLFI